MSARPVTIAIQFTSGDHAAIPVERGWRVTSMEGVAVLIIKSGQQEPGDPPGFPRMVVPLANVLAFEVRRSVPEDYQPKGGDAG
jgi:hypothetical protein